MMWHVDQHRRRRRRRTLTQRLDAHARTFTAVIGRIDLLDQHQTRQDSAQTDTETRLLDLEAQVRELLDQLRQRDATTTSVSGGPTERLAALRAAPIGLLPGPVTTEPAG